MDISYQLYSSRNFQPLSATLTLLKSLGYSQVEGYGGLFTNHNELAQIKADLDSNELTMPSCHIGLQQLQQQSELVSEIITSLGIKNVYVPAVPQEQRVKNAAGWHQLGRELVEAGKVVTDAGASFGWHNHAYEFAEIDSEQLPLDLLLASSDDMMLELDIAWAVIGKQDPIEWMRRYADRINAVHIKDIAPAGECADEDGWADVGHGTLDWPALMKSVRNTQAQYFVMEHDNPNDHVRFATRSIATVISL